MRWRPALLIMSAIVTFGALALASCGDETRYSADDFRSFRWTYGGTGVFQTEGGFAIGRRLSRRPMAAGGSSLARCMRWRYMFCMSKMITARVADDLFAEVDRQARKDRIPRAQAVQRALAMWVAARRHGAQVREEHRAYEEQPVSASEFDLVLGAQRWPK